MDVRLLIIAEGAALAALRPAPVPPAPDPTDEPDELPMYAKERRLEAELLLRQDDQLQAALSRCEEVGVDLWHEVNRTLDERVELERLRLDPGAARRRLGLYATGALLIGLAEVALNLGPASWLVGADPWNLLHDPLPVSGGAIGLALFLFLAQIVPAHHLLGEPHGRTNVVRHRPS